MSLTVQERQILEHIVVASDNNPERPEFPPDDPKFPATPTYQITVPGFSNVWLKDESVNPTGTHKDRMAWEIIVTYRDILQAKDRGQYEGTLPSMSIISSGSAAVSLQTYLKQYGLPNLKTLVDESVDTSTVSYLKELGCEVYTTNLAKKVLSWRDILTLTNNPQGLDITSSDTLDPNHRFYDWMSYEILNNSPEYCFIPFGTGNLYENILNISKKEVSSLEPDPRLSGDVEVIRRCHYLGATTSSPKSQAAKLYSPHLPFAHFDDQWLRLYKYAGFCGAKSGVLQVQEEFLDQAMQLATEQNINCEPSGIAGLALLLQMKEQVPTDAKIVIVNTGKVKPWTT